MKEMNSVQYTSDKIKIKKLPQEGEDLQVFIRPGDSVEFPVDLKDATYQLVGGDILFKLPDGGTITFVSMGLLAFSDSSVSVDFPSASLTLLDILSQVDDVKESPIEAVVTDEFVKLNDEYSDTKDIEVAPENQNFSKILQEPTPAVSQQKLKKIDDDTAKPTEEVEQNNFDAVYKPTDDNPINVNVSEVNNAVEAGLKYTFTAFQTAAFETKAAGVVSRVDGGGGSEYGSNVDTPEAQFQIETLDYSTTKDANGNVSNNTQTITIHADAPKLFKTDPSDLNSQSQLSRDLSIKPEQPIGFGISQISISNLDSGFKIVGATFSGGSWEIPRATYDADGNILTDGFDVDINTGRARFTMTYPEDLLEGRDVVAVINFTSTFDRNNLLPGENVDVPDVTSLTGQGRLEMITKEIDWDSPTGYEGFIDADERVVLAINPNNNVIFTSHGDSTVYGGEGRDEVTAYEGADTLYGAKGNDTLDGGEGNDTIFGGEGNDTLLGKEGINTLDGGEGIDKVDYSYVQDTAGIKVDLEQNSAANLNLNISDTLLNIEDVLGSQKGDTLVGDTLNNVLDGQAGDDTLLGSSGDDTLLGDLGDDELFGGDGNDLLEGGLQSDTLIGNAGNDTLLGGGDDDKLFYDAGTDTIDGGFGVDRVDYVNYSTPLVARIENGSVFVSSDSEGDVVDNIEILSASLYNDKITGSDDSDTIYGNEGNDELLGGLSGDKLYGELGDDTIDGGAGGDYIEAGAGGDTIIGGLGSDTIIGGIGIDTADYSDEKAIKVTLNEGSAVVVNISGSDNDTISEVENIQGSLLYNDSIVGDAVVNVIEGQGGDDTLRGAGGDDTLIGSIGDDFLEGGEGDDIIDGGTHNALGDTVDYSNSSDYIELDLRKDGIAQDTKNSGVDTLSGIENIVASRYDDVLYGTALRNTILSGDGSDTIDAGDGDNVVESGAGDDTLTIGDGSNTIDTSSGADTLDYSNSGGVDVDLDLSNRVGAEHNGFTDSIKNVENIIGSDGGSDTIIGDTKDNTFIGNAGDDTLFGEEGHDRLVAGDGNDYVKAGSGDDFVDGGSNTATVGDTIDYSDAANGITLDLTQSGSQFISSDMGFDTIVNIENIVSSNYDDTLISSADKNIISSGSGDDSIVMSSANDTIDGGLGSDTLDYGAATTGVELTLNNASSVFTNSITHADGFSGTDQISNVENIIGSDSANDSLVGDNSGNSFITGGGDDTLEGRVGADYLSGGLGSDSAIYSSEGGISVTLNGSNDVEVIVVGGDKDTLNSIENITGSLVGSDSIVGDSENNTFIGQGGDDTLIGNAGDDNLDGGDGDDYFKGGSGDDIISGSEGVETLGDTVDYTDATNAISVDLEITTGQLISADRGTDTLLNIENINASDFNDTLYGSAEKNIVNAGSGDDVIDTRAGDDTINAEAGNDTIVIHPSGSNVVDGGDDSDTLDYSATGGVSIDIDGSNAVSATHDGVVDSVKNVENIIGSQTADDVILGDRKDNTFVGNAGDDTLVGESGNDNLDGGDGDDYIKAGSGDDIVVGGENDELLGDTIDYSEASNGITLDLTDTSAQTISSDMGVDTISEIENAIASNFNDTITTTADKNSIDARGGEDSIIASSANDTIDGGLGSDTLDYAAAVSGVELTLDGSNMVLTNQISFGSASGVDQLKNIENIVGSSVADDSLVGDTKDNYFSSLGGNDTLIGKDGSDTLIAGDGDDFLSGGTGSDLLDGGADNDTADYSSLGGISVTLDGANEVDAVVNAGNTDKLKNIENIIGSNLEGDSIVGDSADNYFQGQGGDDTLVGNDGVDILEGGSGKDFLSGGSGDDTIDGGADADTVNYSEQDKVVLTLEEGAAEALATVGTSGEVDKVYSVENIIGSNTGDDTLSGNSLANTLDGLGGADTIHGLSGQDVIDGGAGEDRLFGEADADTITGGSGNDFLEGGLGDDTLDGGADNDTVSYENAANSVEVRLDQGLATGEGSDTLFKIENVIGSSNSDSIVGNSDTNIINAGAGVDTVFGGAGNDTLYGEADADTLSGGDGVDYIYGGDATTDTDTDDMVSYKDVNSGVGVSVDLTKDNSNATNAVTSNDGYNNVDYIYGVENVRGTDYKDIIVADAKDNLLLGELGNDTLSGGLGDDTLEGGANDDLLRGDGGNDTLLGGTGSDTADYTTATTAVKVDLANYDGAGFNVQEDGEGTKDRLVDVENIIGTNLAAQSDTIVGDTNNNIISGLDGNDTLSGGSGLDTLDGGLGDDTLFGGADADTLIGGAGLHDIVDFSDVTANGVNVNLATGIATGDGNDKLETIEDIRGSNLADTLSGNDTANTIYGGDGADVLEGGSKTLGGADEDLLIGEDGDDTLRGDEGNDTLYGGDDTTDTGSDTADYSTVTNLTNTGIDADLTRATPQVIEDGYGTQDTLDGIENISGTDYNDLIKGSDETAELNVLSGNDGDDSFITSDGADSIIGGVGKDTIDYNAITNAANTGIVMDFDSIVDEKSVTKTTATATYIDKVQSIERIIATNYADDIKGDAGANEYFGMGGDDTILGNSGEDTLYGDDLANTLTGVDILDGGDDDDELHAGKGDDTLIGGKGSDLIDGGDDFDIVDYTANEAKISLSGNRVIESATETDTLQNIELIYATLYGDTLVGGAGKDVIDGRGGVDTILGKDGEDTLYGYTGSDTINGGLGSDVLIGGSDADINTVGFNEVVVGSAVEDLNSVVAVDLESANGASIVSLNQATAITAGTDYSFEVNLLDAAGAVVSTTTATHTATATDTGDTIIAALYAQVEAITGIKTLEDISNSPNNDVDFNSHRILFMDDATANGFSITGIDTNILATEQAGVATSLNTNTAVIDKDFIFDFDNIRGTDILLDGATRVGDTLEGNSGNNIINAGAGDDTIMVTVGTDILDGQADSDWVDYSSQTTHAEVTLDDGLGEGSDNFGDTLKNIENIRGTDVASGDTLIGDANDNIIEGGGNSTGTGNRDTLSGGAGNDTLYGQDGEDYILGGADDDLLFGGAANDSLVGGTGVDSYDGGSGYDIVDYYNIPILLDMQNTSRTDANGDNSTTTFTDVEAIYSSDGADEIIVTGNMNIASRNGNDILKGGTGVNTISGGDGDDLIDGGAGADSLYGGRGNDTFYASEGIDILDGGDYTDTIDFRDDRTYTSIDATASTQAIGKNVTEGINLDLENQQILDNGFGEIGTIISIENVEATNFDDIFRGNASKNIVNLYKGDDTAFLSDGSDTIDGGDNNALASGGGDWVDATYITSAGAIYLNNGSEYMGTPGGKVTNFEHIKASAYNDYMLRGDSQDNSILGMAGDDTLVGLEGDDYLDGGSDSDTATYSYASSTSPSKIVVHYDTAIKTVSDGFGGTDTLVSIETVVGSAYNDTFYGSTGDDVFQSGGGQDSFVSSLGDDVLSGNEGGVAASLVDYSNVDADNKLILDLSAANDQAELVATVGGAKHFTDQLQNMKNVIATNESDTLTGSTADNSMYALGGDDTFIATDGNDTYDGGGSVVGDWVDYSASGTTIISNLDIGSTSKGINGSSDGLNSIEHIETGSANDTITASASDNTIIGNAGDDKITSNAGNNVFYGDDSTDTTTNDGTADEIRYDFEDTGSGVDVNLSAVDANTGTATNAYGGTDTLYNFENVIGSANSDTIVGNALANKIVGGAGADTITGGAAGDTLLGSAGDDLFKFTSSEFGGDASVDGGDDIDTIEITDAAAIGDSDFANIQNIEKLLLSSDNTHNVTLGVNADGVGIGEVDATAAVNNSVTVNVSAMSNDLVIKTSSSADSVKLGAGTDIVNTYGGNDVIEYDGASKVKNAVGSLGDTIDAGTGDDTLYANSDEDYDFSYDIDSKVSISGIEKLKFFDDGAAVNNQSIKINSDLAADIVSFEGNAAQTNTIEVKNDATVNNIDLTTGKTLTNIEKTIINSTLNIESTLTGNTATKDAITGSDAKDVISGLGGDDTLIGMGGDDTFVDGTGTDTIDAGSGNDLIQFSIANLDATNGNDTIIGGADDDTLEILDAVTTATLTDTLLTNVSEIEHIQFANVANDITLNQDGVELIGGTSTDAFNYGGTDFTNADTIDGNNGTDELNLTTAATKTLTDFANVSNIELLNTSAGDDDIDLSGAEFTEMFDSITMGDGDDTLTIDANNVWIGKTLDGGGNTPTGDTLEIVGTVSVDLSATTVINFENISSASDLSLTVKQVNALGTIDVGGKTLSVVGNDGETTMSATDITAGTLKFTSGMTDPTTVNNIHMNIDASGSSQSITMGIDAATTKTALEIKGSSAGADTLNVALNADEVLTTGFKVDNQVETFNLSVNGNNALDLTNIATATTLKTTGSTGTLTVDNAGNNIDASNLAATEVLEVNATSAAISIIGGASLVDTVTLGSGDTYGSISGIEILNIEEDNNLSGKISNDVTNINITNTKILTLIAADLDANSLSIDDGTTVFRAGLVGDNNFSGVTLTNASELVMQVNAGLDISSQGSDNIVSITEVDIADNITFTLNADQTDSDLDVKGATASSSLVIESTTDDVQNDFSGITKNAANAGTITYRVLNAVDKTSEAANIFGAIDTLDVTGANILKVDSPQLTNVTTLNGAGTLDVVGDGNVDLSTLDGTFSGEVLISDVVAVETITGSKFDDIVTIDAGTGDSVNTGAGEDKILLSQDVAAVDGGAGTTDEIELNASGLDLSSTTITGIEKISFNVGGVSEVTMNSSDVNSIAIIGDGSTNTINIADTGVIDLSGANLTSIEELVFNDAAVNTITADLDGVNLLLGDSGDTLKIDATSFSTTDTITGGSGTDTIEFTNGGTVADTAFSNVSSIERVQFSDNATSLTLGNQAGLIATITGGSSTSDSLTLNGGGSYTNISAVETLNVDKTIDLSGKITDVETINVLSSNGVLTLDADDFTNAIVINNDKTLTINDATTTTISNLDLTGSTGDTTINLTAGGTAIDFSSVTFAGNVSLVGSAGSDTMSVDEGVALFDGGAGADELIIKAGSSDSFSASSIVRFETITVNESVDLSGAIDDDIVTDIDVANTKTVTLTAADLDGKTIDFGGTGDTTFAAGVADANDFANISVSGAGKLTMAVSSTLDISASGVDNIAAITHVTLASGVTLTLSASQTDNTLNIDGNNANSDLIIKAALADSDNDFTSFVNNGGGNIILDVVQNIDKSGEASGILGAIDTINLSDNTKSIILDANQIASLTTLEGSGTLTVNAVGGAADLSGLANGGFSGTINIIVDSTQADTITGSAFNDNIVYSADAQADTLDGGTGVNTILVNNDADLSALSGANVTNITKMDVSGNFTATVDKDFVENSGVTTYTGAGGSTDFIKVALSDGEDINLTSQTFSALKVKIDVAGGGADSTITGSDDVSNIITLIDGTNTITTFGDADTITGGSGADTINIGGGDDIVDAGGGDDVIRVSTTSLTTNDILDGGADNDTIEFLTGTAGVDHTKFTQVTGIQTLKTADADTTIDFTTDAGSISIVDASSMTAGSNLTLTTGAQLTQVTGGASADVITYLDANLTSVDIVDGGDAKDTLVISDGANVIASDLSSISNVEVLALSNNTNTVDLTSSSIDSIEGGSVADTITAQGDELSIKTNAGDDTVYISSVPSGLIDGGGNTATGDTLNVTGDLDLSGANIINFENIVASGSITLSIAQADGVNMTIAAGKTLTIKDSSGAGTLNAANISGNQLNITTLTAALTITGLAVALNAATTTQNLTLESSDGSLDITGSTGAATTTIEYTASTILSGILTDVDTVIADSGLTVDATILDGKTQEFSTTNIITINATANSTDHDFDNITQIGSGKVVLNVDSGVDLSAQNIIVVDDFDVKAGETLTLDASQLSTKSTTATGIYQVNNLDATLDADFSGVDSAASVSADYSGTDTDAEYTGNLTNIDSVNISAGTMSIRGSEISAETVTGTGSLRVLSGGTIDVGNVSGVTLLADIDTSVATIQNLAIDLDGTNSSKDLTIETNELGLAIKGGAGNDSIVYGGVTGIYTGTFTSIEKFSTANALSFDATNLSSKTLDFIGGGDITITAVDTASTDLNAVTYSGAGDVVLTATTTGTVDTTGMTFTGADTVTLNGGTGDNSFTIDQAVTTVDGKGESSADTLTIETGGSVGTITEIETINANTDVTLDTSDSKLATVNIADTVDITMSADDATGIAINKVGASGTLIVNNEGAGTLVATDIATDIITLTNGVNAALTVSDLKINLDGTAATGALDVSVIADGVTVTTNSTTNIIRATALTDGQTLTLDGAGADTVNLGAGDLSAATATGVLTVNAGTGGNIITTGTGNDTVNVDANFTSIDGTSGVDTIDINTANLSITGTINNIDTINVNESVDLSGATINHLPTFSVDVNKILTLTATQASGATITGNGKLIIDEGSGNIDTSSIDIATIEVTSVTGTTTLQGVQTDVVATNATQNVAVEIADSVVLSTTTIDVKGSTDVATTTVTASLAADENVTKLTTDAEVDSVELTLGATGTNEITATTVLSDTIVLKTGGGTADATVTGLKTDLNASNLVSGETLNATTSELNHAITGGADSNDTVTYNGVAGTYSGALVDIENFSTDVALSFSATNLSSKTLDFIGGGDITITAVDTASTDLNAVTYSGAGDVVLTATATGAVDTTGMTFTGADTVTLNGGTDDNSFTIDQAVTTVDGKGESSADILTIETGGSVATIIGIESLVLNRAIDMSAVTLDTASLTNIDTNSNLLTLADTQLAGDTYTFSADSKVTFTKDTTGTVDYSGVTVASGGELTMVVSASSADIDNVSNLGAITDVTLNDNITINSKAIDSSSFAIASATTKMLTIEAQDTDTVDMSVITKDASDTNSLLKLNLVNGSTATLSDITTATDEVAIGGTLTTSDNAVLNTKAINVTGAGTLNITNDDGVVNLDALTGTFSGTVNIDDQGSDTITGSLFKDNITLNTAGNDTVDAKEGNDTISVNEDFTSIDGGADNDVINIDTTGLILTGTISNVETINVNESTDLSGATVNDAPNIVVASGKVLTLDDVDIANYTTISGDGKLEIKSGSGAINVANVTTAMIVLATALSASVTLDNVKTSVDGSSHAEGLTINVDTSVNLASDTRVFMGGAGTDVLSATLATGENIANTVTIDSNIENSNFTITDTHSIDATNIDSTITLLTGAGTTGTTTLSAVASEVDASSLVSGQDLSVTVENLATTVTTGAGSNTIDATALADAVSLRVLGDDDVTITLGAGDVDASGMTGTPVITVNGGTGSNDIKTADGADIINLSSGDDTVTTGAGSDTVNIDGDNLDLNDAIDAGAGDTDILNITANGTLADTDFTNLSNFNTLNMTAVADSVELGTEAAGAFEAGSTVNGLAGDDDFTIDFSNLGQFTIDAGIDNDTLALSNYNTENIDRTNSAVSNLETLNLLDASSITIDAEALDNWRTAGSNITISGSSNDTLDISATGADFKIEDSSNVWQDSIADIAAGTYNVSTDGDTSSVEFQLIIS